MIVQAADPPSAAARAGDRRAVLAPPVLLGVAALVVLAPARDLFLRPVTAQDDGLLLAYPDLVLRGAVPNLDFATVYGPLTSWVTAAAFWAIEPSVLVLRSVGLALRLLALVAVWLLVRRVSRTGAGLAVVGGALVVSTTDLMPSAAIGALALGLLALVAAGPDRPVAAWRCGAAGIAGGLAAGFRWDGALPVVLSLLPVLLAWSGRRRLLLAAGFVVGLLPWAVEVVLAGPDAVWRNVVTEPLLVSSAGRRLPLTDVPVPLPAGLALVVGVGLAAVVVGARRRHRLLLALALICLGQVPYLVSRLDLAHLAPMLVVPIATAVVLASPFAVPGRVAVGALAGAVVLAALGPLWAYGVKRSVLGRPVASVVVGERSVPLPPAIAPDVQAAVDAVVRVSRPGDRLAVLPGDPSRAFYNDTYLYFLLPGWRPAPFHLEMNPGVANAAGSVLPGQVATADVVVTDDAWNRSDEPNTADAPGSDATARVLAGRFVEVGRWGTVRVLQRDR
ncbi:hypothetical protein [Actinomycetospora sp. NBRC 106378]|uniref:hypothetical protein n=1 Tax=Actinomycetospora sp. NBRC 106378 TaxID=3032208 RepID=UPI0025538A36|nr:hypothetical protein [Actinomycetospora sp. NBRC 106378]